MNATIWTPPNIELVYKALSNETRRQILQWLKDPAAYFDAERYSERGLDISAGVCVGDIQAKTGLAQSVISGYLITLQRAGLLISERLGKWTYYRRNERSIAAFADIVRREL
ncbi:ArsR/SmtB family transcription factor [Paeniglutamicibacter sp. NPDC012692]|uniref:ArsR/SmtB family transcription factor n=1 Tax=Paeniglutamicibacter sp. NPDC012692 TaxID=3364388 RepID=UPI003687D9BC